MNSRDPSKPIARNLAVKLMVYATGTPLTPADRLEVDAIVERVRDKNYGLRSLLLEIVQSKAFQRQGRGEKGGDDSQRCNGAPCRRNPVTATAFKSLCLGGEIASSDYAQLRFIEQELKWVL